MSNAASTHHTASDIAALDHVADLGKTLAEGDSVAYVDDGMGSGGYIDGCGDDVSWDAIRQTLSRRGLRMDDIGGHYDVVAG